ncbi:MAG: oligosaccharide flippase family protein [Bacteroidales bacterium]|nr:oligosaccharide flippase family protein [Bacteroidales bacterium]
MAINPIKKLAGDTLIYGLGTMVPRLLNYLLVPFYTILVFNQAQYGQITSLYAYLALLLVVLTFGMETGFFRYANLSRQPLKIFNVASTVVLFVSALFFFLTTIFLDDIVQTMGYSGHKFTVLLVVLIVVLDALTAIPFAFLRYKEKAKRFSFIRISTVVVNIALNLTFLVLIPKLLGDAVHEYRLYQGNTKIVFVFISNVASSLLAFLLLWPEWRHFRINLDKELLSKMLNYSYPVLIIGLASIINEVADKILLKYFLPDPATADAQIGIYGAAYKLAILMMLFIQMFRYAAEPFFFAESDKKNAKQTYSRVMTYFVIFTCFIFLGVTLYLDVFKYFIGKNFWGGLAVVPVILAAKLFLGVFYNLSVWYKLTNKTLYGAVIALIGVGITIGINVVFIPKYGFMASAWANFACYLSMLLISFVWGRRVYRINYNFKKLLAYSLLAVGLYFLAGLFTDVEYGFHLLINTVLIAVYVGFVFLFERKFFSPRFQRPHLKQ